MNSLYIASTRQITSKQHRKVVPLPIVSFYSNETDRLTSVKYFWMFDKLSNGQMQDPWKEPRCVYSQPPRRNKISYADKRNITLIVQVAHIWMFNQNNKWKRYNLTSSGDCKFLTSLDCMQSGCIERKQPILDYQITCYPPPKSRQTVCVYQGEWATKCIRLHYSIWLYSSDHL